LTPSQDTRLCKGCGLSLPREKYPPWQWNRGGAQCRNCLRRKNREYYAANKERIRGCQKAYREEFREEIRARQQRLWKERGHLWGPARKKWREENREKTTEQQRQRRERFCAWINSLKEGVPCADCGHVFDPYTMEYDHVRGTKRTSIGKMTNHRRERVLEEIAKCDLVCCACHRIRSHARRQPAGTPKLVAFRQRMAEKKKAPCVDCGEVLPPEAMDFDHVEGEKVAQITDMWSWADSKVEKELSKCELVCANCHRKRTIKALDSLTEAHTLWL